MHAYVYTMYNGLWKGIVWSLAERAAKGGGRVVERRCDRIRQPKSYLTDLNHCTGDRHRMKG